jgi:hypothetical protein
LQGGASGVIPNLFQPKIKRQPDFLLAVPTFKKETYSSLSCHRKTITSLGSHSHVRISSDISFDWGVVAQPFRLWLVHRLCSVTFLDLPSNSTFLFFPRHRGKLVETFHKPVKVEWFIFL